MDVPSFLGRNTPILCDMLTQRNPTDCIANIRNAIFDGADAFALHICYLEPQYRNEQTFRDLFLYAEDKPVGVINYRGEYSKGLTEDERVEQMLTALRAGATLCDVMGDLYGEGAPCQFTADPAAADQQKRLIERVHAMGREVLMSCHVMKYRTAEQTLEQAAAMEARGADIVKLVVMADNEEELLDTFRTTALLKRELKVPFLHICGGQNGKRHRALAPVFGSCMVLCEQKYEAFGNREQPLLRATRALYNNLDWKPGRE